MTVSEANLILQWQAAADLIETTRAFFDDNLVGGAPDLLNTLEKTLEGVYTPIGLATAASSFRAGASSLLSSSRIADFLRPILYEYGQIVDSGGGYRNHEALIRSLYEYFAYNTPSPITVQSRGITFDTWATAAKSSRVEAGIVGTGYITRLTTDENGFPLEACHVETKTFRCRADANNGARAVEAEVFEVLGDPASPDNLGRAAFGSGDYARVLVPSMHAGAAGSAGGSTLNNSSFETYSATATPKFSGWTETTGGADISQDTTVTYRTFPGESTAASMKLVWSGTTILVKQSLANMRRTKLDSTLPYFLRVMVYKDTATAGNIVIRMGAQSTSVPVSGLLAGWNEVTMKIDTADNQKKMWFSQYNEADFDVELEWNTGTTNGHILHFDDVIFAPWVPVDGTFVAIRGAAPAHTAWQVDDMVTFTDTGGAPATGKIQWQMFQAFGAYLPSSGTPTIADPT